MLTESTLAGDVRQVPDGTWQGSHHASTRERFVSLAALEHLRGEQTGLPDDRLAAETSSEKPREQTDSVLDMTEDYAKKEGYRVGIMACRVCGCEAKVAINPPPDDPNKQKCWNCGSKDNDWEEDKE
jgi:hypothetical protein